MDYLVLLRGVNCSGMGGVMLVMTTLKVHLGQLVLSL